MPYVFSFSLFLNIVNTTARRIKGQGKASARTGPTLSSSLGFSVQTLTHPGGGGGLEDQGSLRTPAAGHAPAEFSQTLEA